MVPSTVVGADLEEDGQALLLVLKRRPSEAFSTPLTPCAGRHGAMDSQSLLPSPPETYRPLGDVIRPLMRVHGCRLLTHPMEGEVLGNFMCQTQHQLLCPC